MSGMCLDLGVFSSTVLSTQWAFSVWKFMSFWTISWLISFPSFSPFSLSGTLQCPCWPSREVFINSLPSSISLFFALFWGQLLQLFISLPQFFLFCYHFLNLCSLNCICSCFMHVIEFITLRILMVELFGFVLYFLLPKWVAFLPSQYFLFFWFLSSTLESFLQCRMSLGYLVMHENLHVCRWGCRVHRSRLGRFPRDNLLTPFWQVRVQLPRAIQSLVPPKEYTQALTYTSQPSL